MPALTGLRVLDFTRVLAGPLCTMILADLGADVVKVERPGTGDDTRHWGPPWIGEGDSAMSAYFASINRNKRSITLHLKSAAGRSAARELIAQSNVLVENFMPGEMAQFGLDYAEASALNPSLVYCSITGYGQTGPYHQRRGYDYAIQAMSGLMSITGPAEGEPMKAGVAISDIIAGLNAANAIQAAVRHAELTSEGQYIDIALLDTQIAALVNVATSYLVSGEAPLRYGSQHPNIVPYQTFHSADQDFVVAVGNDRQFALLCEVLGRAEWNQDARFATNPARVQHRDELIPLLQAVFYQRCADDWVEALLKRGIPSGPINDLPTMMNDPHMQARGLLHTTSLSNGEPLTMVASPLKLSATPPEVRLPPPLLGEHQSEVLREWLNRDIPMIPTPGHNS